MSLFKKGIIAKQECAIVMYHYVRDMHLTDYPGIKGRSVKEFIYQIDYILRNYAVISLDDYVEYLNNESEIPARSCILTFDDGFIDHYSNVYPILKAKGIPACFFPVMQPLVEFIIPVVHQTHFLLAKLGSKAFSDEFNEVIRGISSKYAEEFLVDDKVRKTNKCEWDNADILASNLRYNISIMPSGLKTGVLNRMFSEHFNNRERFCRNLYMNFGQMKEMLANGMAFGGHTFSHPSLSSLSRKEQLEEIGPSAATLERELGTRIRHFSYPYGSYNSETIDILRELGYSCALTTNFDINRGKAEAFALNRLDTNHLPAD